jgi:hypothetical protein
VNQGNRCGRLFGLAALTIAALIAATAANADPGVGGVHSATPTLPGVPPVSAAPGLPAPPTVVGLPATVTAASKATHAPSYATVTQLHGKPIVLPKHKVTVNAVMTIRVRSTGASGKHAKQKLTTTVTVLVNGHKVKVNARKLAATPNCPQDSTTIHCVNQPWEAPLDNNCPGANDVVDTVGTFQYLIQSTFDPVAMTLTSSERINWQNVSGVVTDSAYPSHIGNKYQANDTEKTYQSVTPVGLDGVQYVTDHDENNELISLGPLPNQIIHMMTHAVVTVDSSGVHVSPPTVQGPGIKCTG